MWEPPEHDEPIERPNRDEPRVARSRAVVSSRFELVEKRENQWRIKVVDGDLIECGTGAQSVNTFALVAAFSGLSQLGGLRPPHRPMTRRLHAEGRLGRSLPAALSIS